MTGILRIQTNSPDETQRLGELIGQQARAGDLYLLTGPLGAGKTCLTQGIGRGLEVPENLRSPTFVLMTRHRGRLLLHHLDLYRINDPWEAWDLGIDEQLFSEGVCIVEWTDKAKDLFPPESLWLDLEYGTGDSERLLTLTAALPNYEPLLKSLAASFPYLSKS